METQLMVLFDGLWLMLLLHVEVVLRLVLGGVASETHFT